MDNISKFLKTNTTALSLFFQGVMNISLGVLMLSNKAFFIKSVSQLLITYFAITVLLNIAMVAFNLTKGIKKLWNSLVKAVFSATVATFIAFNLKHVWALIPLIMSTWTMLVGFASIVSFWQYRHEKSSAPVRYLVSAFLNLGFGISFITNLVGSVPLSLSVMGIYLILLGFTNFTDCTSSAVPAKYKSKLKRKIRITAPPFLTALIPIKILNSINEYFAQEGEQDTSLCAVKENSLPNVEVFVHVSPSAFGAMGHVDIAIDQRVVSFGGYDLDSMKLGGGIGVGVLFEHFKKQEYIELSQKQLDKTLFGFGLVLTEEEKQKILQKLEDIKKRTYIWKCKAQIAQEKGEDITDINDYASCLYKATGVTYYKFKSGSFKYYWVLGTNCVKLADTLLSSSGLDTVLSGIITPGTYYDYLNKEFMRPGSRVVKRTVYYAKSLKREDE